MEHKCVGDSLAKATDTVQTNIDYNNDAFADRPSQTFPELWNATSLSNNVTGRTYGCSRCMQECASDLQVKHDRLHVDQSWIKYRIYELMTPIH